MNKTRFSRTAQNINPNSHPHLFIRRSEIAFADTTFVERVLAILIESRFGPGGEYEKLESPRDLPDFEPVLFSDLLDDDLSVSFWDAQNCQRCRSPHVSKGVTHNIECHALAHARACATFSGTQNPAGGNASVNERAVSRPPVTPNQGRGSP